MEIWQNLKKKRNTDYNFLTQQIVEAEDNKKKSFMQVRLNTVVAHLAS